jgi:hypothetical protein
MIYEKDLHGEYRGFDDVDSYISNREWENYVHEYDCRINTLYESQLEERMGEAKYGRRRLFLDRFDDWKYWTARRQNYPWHWGIDEIKERKAQYRSDARTVLQGVGDNPRVSEGRDCEES